MAMNDATFNRFSQWMKQHTGVHLPASKKTLVQERLHKRLHARQINSMEAYFRLLGAPHEEAERQIAIDLLTTHETYFFREVKHFDWLRAQLAQQPRDRPYRVWCAAASSGEEPWSLAMVLADSLGLGQDAWHVLGSDISQAVLDKAQRGHYPLTRCEGIPQNYLRRFCLKGTGRQEGTLLIDRPLRAFVSWRQINLDRPLPAIGQFELIFMRNVLIYFNPQTKQEVLLRASAHLPPGGHLVVSHSESLHGLDLPLAAVLPGIYRKTS